ncbi:phosphatidylglycerophosphatase B [Vibrio orientalis CIP 102891 = ATCC 33934]|uniref:undecaprenyl-diphosphate phosphatase n=1 Tax=Vibrio orientalis CIP 102891 = ATCC 33934 TaxID=675816 RepID=C9QGG6_VIBOR|nr:phosphatase PAP2 family protein [Vibrio orientalis]EEX94846.1 membrane-associated phospholipid phosphatase [Vibrio orientalis CIP 102891 = ATCC 33934]EGU53022.1 phosphatidylglycerophosphatase B [Vibrio orientalis CIP 102891 = ATCC 33934]
MIKKIFQDKREGLLLLLGFLLIIAPMSLFVSHIDLLSEVSDATGVSFTAITESAGSKGFLITLSILVLMSWKVIGFNREFLAKLFQLGVILVIGFAAKTGLKHVTESPRPYTELLTHQLLIPNPVHFYKLDAIQKEEVINEISQQVSPWRTSHWQGEKDYSFPSGHTIFASICLAFFGGLFMQHKRYGLALMVGVWAICVGYSRLWLGMHRPIDLVGSILFVAAVYTLMPSFSQLGQWVMLRLKYPTHVHR